MGVRELAAAAGVDSAQISRLESGKNKSMRRDQLAQVAQALGVPVTEILRATGVGKLGPASPALPSLEEVLAADPNLTDEQRQVMLNLYWSYVRPAHLQPSADAERS